MGKITIPSGQIKKSSFLSHKSEMAMSITSVKSALGKLGVFSVLYMLLIGSSLAAPNEVVESCSDELKISTFYADPVLDLDFYDVGVDNEVQFRPTTGNISGLSVVPSLSSDTSTIQSAIIDFANNVDPNEILYSTLGPTNLFLTAPFSTTNFTVGGVTLRVAQTTSNFVVTEASGNPISNDVFLEFLSTLYYRNATNTPTPGIRTVTIQVIDPNGASGSAQNIIRVFANGPVASDDTDAVNGDNAGTITGDVLVNDTGAGLVVSEVDVYPTQVGVLYETLYGSIVIQSNGTYTYDVDESSSSVTGLKTGESLVDIISYTIKDNNDIIDYGILSITINGVDEAPDAQDNADSITVVTEVDVSGNIITDEGVNGVDFIDRGLTTLVWETEFPTAGPSPQYSTPVDGQIRGVNGVQLEFFSTDVDNIGIPNQNQTVALTGTNGGHFGYLRFGIQASTNPVNDTELRITFDEPVFNLGFLLVDIDFSQATVWQDQIKINGSLDGVTSAYKFVTTGGVVDAGGDTFYGIGNAVPSDATGNINILFEEPVNELIFSYNYGPNVTDNPPGGQIAGISDIYWQGKAEDIVIIEIDGNPVAVGGSVFVGEYGSIEVFPDGTYTYTPDTSNPAVAGLLTGQTLTEDFDYVLSDGVATDQAQLIITLNGDKTAPTITIDTPIEGDNIVDSAEVGSVSTSGTTTDVEDGQIVTVTFSDGTNTVTTTATVTGGVWTATDVDISSLSNGPITVTADVTDVGGNPATDNAPVTLDKNLGVPIDAMDDSYTATAEEGVNGITLGDVLSNDVINGVPVDPADVTITPNTDGPLTVNADGTVTVAANTAPGTYTVDYTVCQDGTTPPDSNCDTATATVVVSAPDPIDAMDDSYTATAEEGVNGITLGDVLSNDVINGVPVDPADVTITPNTDGPLTVNADGTVTVAANTAPGTYTVDYTVCEDGTAPPNSNCDTATATVVISAPDPIDAMDDSYTATAEEGVTGITLGDVLSNDVINGVPVDPADVTITPNTDGPLTVNADGTVTVAANTAPGTYTVDYTVCEDGTAPPNSNCDTATATVVVSASDPIDAMDDSYTATAEEGVNGITLGDVLSNDVINGIPVDPADVTITPNTDGPLTVNVDGTVTVAANTAPGTYTVDYTVCQDGTAPPNSNCDTATATVVVSKPDPIDAMDDSYTATAEEGVNGITLGDVLSNDVINGVPVDTADVTITPNTDGPLTVNVDGTVTVAANTAPGTYTVDYTVCEDGTAPPNSNCDTATATVVVSAPDPIDAMDDSYTATAEEGVNGITLGDILSNDVINGVPVDPADVTITPNTDGPLTVNADGTVTVAANTAPGTYTVDYTVCEDGTAPPNSNCDTATATVVVSAPDPIDAMDDSYTATAEEGVNGITLGDVLSNDVINGVPVDPADVTITPNTDGPLTVNADGTVTVAANTAPGTYTVDYTVCEDGTAPPNSNCDTATATVVVSAPDPIDAMDDSYTATAEEGVTGITFSDVLANDTLNGATVDPADVTLTATPTAELSIDPATGDVIVASGTAPGTYTIPYQICETAVPSNCETATATVVVSAPDPIDAMDDSYTATAEEGVNGITLGDVLSNDVINGVPVDPADVTITPNTDGPLTVNADGTVTVAANTAPGTYTVDYTVCEDGTAPPNSNCDTATATVVVSKPDPIDAMDDSYTATAEEGVTGITLGDVLSNDVINGVPVDPADVTITPNTDGPLTVNADGTVTVAANTAPGTYTVDYTVCEDGTAPPNSNCDTATATVVVSAPDPIDAMDDSYTATAEEGVTGITFSDVLANDTLNGATVDPADVTLTATPTAELSIDPATGDVIVASGTAPGTYTIPYQICETAVPSNCETATATVVVSAPDPIDAMDDSYTATAEEGVNGITLGDVLSNDVINGVPVDPADVTITPNTDGPLTVNADGTVTVAANTAPGTYTVDYTICEDGTAPPNSNCDTATATVVVSAPDPIDAMDDSYTATAEEGVNGITLGDVLSNDVINGVPVDPADVTITPNTDGPLTVNADGTVTVAANTAPGTYTVDYTICEDGTAPPNSNCDTATATVVVSAPDPIDAMDDSYTATAEEGVTGITFSDVLANDTLNGATVDPADVTLTATPTAELSIDPATGDVIVASGTAPGTYTIPYQICETAVPSNCETATATVVVSAPDPIDAMDDSYTATAEEGVNGITLGDVLSNDVINGVPVDPADVTITPNTDGPLTVNADGTVTVAANTAPGTYTVDYTVCEDGTAPPNSNCDTATATVVVSAPDPIDAMDDSYTATAEEGVTGITFSDVLANDTLNGATVDPADVTLTATPTAELSIDPATGDVIVASGTAPGTYTIPYQICETAVPSNCETATATVVVSAPDPIDAMDDSYTATAEEGVTGITFSDVLANDTLNGATVDPADVTLTATPTAELSIDPATGDVIVASGTAPGTYTIPYQICETAVPSNCETAIATVVVSAPDPIDAMDDSYTATAEEGVTGITLGDVLSNDVINGVPVDPADVTITPNTDGPLTVNADGTVTVAANTAPGTYTVDYTVCEDGTAPPNSNCDTATATVVVSAPDPIDAMDDSYTATAEEGVNGITLGDVLSNDVINGVPVDPADVTITPNTDGPLTVNADGTVTVAANTAPGTYTVDYTVCEEGTAPPNSNCDTATATVVVSAPDPIDAMDDSYTATAEEGVTGITFSDVLANDTLNGATVDPADVTLTATPTAELSIDPATGDVIVASGTAPGTYTIPYQICETAVPSNCETAIATVVVSAPDPIDAMDDSYTATAEEGVTGITFSDVLANDTLNGATVDPADVTLTATPTAELSIDPATGDVIVASGTAPGTYTIPYQICETAVPSNCETATATVVVSAPDPIDAMDDSYTATAEEGVTGITLGDVLSNDVINGVPVDPADVTITPNTDGPLTVNADGTVTVAANTAPGTYTVDYTVCEDGTAPPNSNCDTATATVVVSAPDPIDAMDDSYTATAEEGVTGITLGDVLSNDVINGVPVDPADVTITPNTDGPLTVNADGTVTVAANTAPGTYTVDYTVCEDGTAPPNSNCDTATATVVVSAPDPIDAMDDSYTATAEEGVNGITLGDVLSNDVINGVPVDPADVTITPNTDGPLTVNADGTVTVAANTAPGTYTVDYTVCEDGTAPPNSNCDTATATVVVSAPDPIDAMDDSYTATAEEGVNGITLGDVLSNDVINGVPVDPADVTITPNTDGPLTVNADGTVTVAANTAPGTYTVDYTVCEDGTAPPNSNCDTATATVVVSAPDPIDAMDDSYTATAEEGVTGITFSDVLANDTLNGATVDPADVTLTATPTAELSIDPATGDVIVASGTAPGTYTIPYQICETAVPSNCETATATVVVSAPDPIDAMDDSYTATAEEGVTGITFSDVLANDTLNGATVDPADVTLTATPTAELSIDPATGDVIVASGTAPGTYTIPYQICETAVPSNCETATATVVVSAPDPIDAMDDSYTATAEDGVTGITLGDVLSNDVINGVPVDPADVTVTPNTDGPLTVNADGTVTVATNTAPGTYTVDYTVCEDGTAPPNSNCDTATATVVVSAPDPIDAMDDSYTATAEEGVTGITFSDVLANDTLNGATVDPADVTLTATPTAELSIDPATGDVIVASGTAQGTYTIPYQICETAVPSNCETATATVVVSAPDPIDAMDDSYTATAEEGVTGITFSDVLANDTLNGATVDPADVTLTATPTAELSIDPATGDVIVASGTAPGTYTIPYQICETAVPSNCETATATVVVSAPDPIDAMDDSYTATAEEGVTGITLGDVLSNDVINGVPVDPADVTITPNTDGPLTVNADGTVTVAANTAPGTYTVDYTVCEDGTAPPNSNCDTATATVVVSAPDPIDAMDDSYTATAEEGVTGITLGDVLSNDVINGVPVDPADVTITPNTDGPLTVNADGTVTVAANTAPGTYTVDYTVCEDGTAPPNSNCDTATATVVVSAPDPIDAMDDSYTATAEEGVNGITLGDVLSNDVINGVPVDPADVTITPNTDGPLTVNADGTVTVAANTAPGTYTVDYTVCEDGTAPPNSNCDTATATVVVSAPDPIDAMDDSYTATAEEGVNGITLGDVLSNDVINGVPVDPADVTITPNTDGPLTVNADGTVTVAANTAPGTYTVDYTVCEDGTAPPNSNCDTATATVVVSAPDPIDAMDDSYTATAEEGVTGITFSDVLANDTLNGATVDPADVTLTATPTAELSIDPATGDVIVASGTAPGTYTIPYQICETAVPSNCETATATVVVSAPDPIDAMDDSYTATAEEGVTGITFSDVLANDTLNGATIDPADVTLTATPTAELSIDPATGDVIVASGTAPGTYTIPYQICETAVPSNCETATATVVVSAPDPIDAMDDSYTATAEDGVTGITLGDVLSNDVINGVPVDPADVTVTPNTDGPLTVNADGTVTVATNTAPGTYTVDYTVCEDGTAPPNSNCDTATATVVVSAPDPIDAMDDSYTATAEEGVTGITFSDVLANDTLNGATVDPADVTLTATPTAELSIDPATGDVIVASGTAQGTYTIPYQICETAVPSNCETATATVVVSAPDPIDAMDDSYTATAEEGVTGITFSDVLANDTLNGATVDPADVTLTATPTAELSIDPATGDVIVASGTAPGTYTIPYQICETAVPSNCETAIATVVVSAPDPIDAMDDSYTATAEEGVNGITLGDVLSNDVINGVPVDPADVTITPNTDGPLTVNADGTVTVAANTAPGTYTVDYTVCEDGTAPTNSNCDTATATVVVSAPDSIDAIDDDYSQTPIDTSLEDVVVGDITINDLMNNVPVSDTEISISIASNGGINGLIIDSDGLLIVPAGTSPGNYTVLYTICEVAVPTNCDTASVQIYIGTCTDFPNYDCDNDGLTNNEELTGVDDPTTPADPDGEITDPLDIDSDGDGVSDGQEAFDGTDPNDNCSLVVANQTEMTDAAYDSADCDMDGLTNNEETTGIDDPSTPNDPNGNTTDPQNPDSDGDGVIDGDEAGDMTDPNDPCALEIASQTVTPTTAWNDLDCDMDGLNNGEELTGVDDPTTPADPDGEITDPLDIDSDGDGVSDGQEALDGTDPNDNCSLVVANQTEMTDAAYDSADCDMDGLTNNEEATGIDDPSTPNDPNGNTTDPQNPDSDGDGVTDGDEAGDMTDPNDPCALEIASQTVTPTTAWNDLDCDMDGLNNGEELTGVDDPTTPADPDGEITDPLDIDSDGDGVTDGQEALDGTDPNDNCSLVVANQTEMTDAAYDSADCDMDGLTNNEETTGIDDPSTPNDPNGNTTDPQNPDSDGDGVTDGDEAGDMTDPNDPCALEIASQTVTPTTAWNDLDCDMDGLNNGEELTGVDDPTTPADPDGEITDPLDIDSDGDGVTDGQEALDGTDPNDNCSLVVANQTEMTDAAYDSADCDMDGLTNNEETTGIDDPSTPNDPNGNTTDPQNPDSDGDGVTDGDEAGDMTDPNDPCDLQVSSQSIDPTQAWNDLDCDMDGLNNGEEITGIDDPDTPADPNGNTTDPTNADTDGDGVTDGDEAEDGTDPNNPCDFLVGSITLTVGGDFDTLDCDGDGVTNGDEIADGTDPFDVCDFVADSQTLLTTPEFDNADCDNDGLTNEEEITGIDNPNTPADPNGNTTDPTNPDTDGDGVLDGREGVDGTNPNDSCSLEVESQTVNVSQDFLDGDCDGDGIPNGDELGDENGNGIPDFLEVNNNNPNATDGLEVFDIMTPNGDGLNDVFVIRGIEQYPNNTVRIYNRWGVEVYGVKGYGQDGQYFRGESNGRATINGDQLLPVGTYYYTVEYTNASGKLQQLAGPLYLNR